MSESEAAEWAEFYKLEPFLADRLEIQLMRIGSMFTNKPELLLVSETFQNKKMTSNRLTTEELAKRLEATLGAIAKKGK